LQFGRPKVLASGRSGPIRCQALPVMNCWITLTVKRHVPAEHPSYFVLFKPLLAALRLDLQKLHDLLKIHFEAIGIIVPARVQ
jgi:hypothetical protein